jgi:putative transcription antitermination factor YqgF
MILALDYGEKRIGVAISDETERFAKALDYLPNKSEPRKIFAKDFPQGTSMQVINDARRAEKREAKIELRKVFNKLLHMINIYYPEVILVGLPTVVDEETQQPKLGVQAKKIKEFVKKLEIFLRQNNIILEIKLIEESMTSHIAEEQLRAQGLTTDKIKEKIDSESAKLLLEGYISVKQ